MYKPLAGMKIVSIAVNLPGPVAAKQLASLGASVFKIEPPGGDPFEKHCPLWYNELIVGQQRLTLDLKSADGKNDLAQILSKSHLLLTAQRLPALKRLGLDWQTLQQHYQKLNHVCILGYAEPMDNHAGHDLTYQASMGLIQPPLMPKTLIADIFERGIGNKNERTQCIRMGELG